MCKCENKHDYYDTKLQKRKLRFTLKKHNFPY